MNILLTKPMTSSSKPWYFPSGLGYIARALIDLGHEVNIIDPEVEQWTLEQHCKAIATSKYDVLGISALINKYRYVCTLAEASKEANPNARIVLGGNITGPIWELLLNKAPIDICVIGEGEITIQEVIRSFEGLSDLESVNGIAFRLNGKPFQTPFREPIENLDDIPFPAYNIFPMEVYITTPGKLARQGFGRRDLSMITSRGCPYHCTFCYRPPWERVRNRSPENIMLELRYLIDKYGIDSITFNDELMLLNKTHIYKICNSIGSTGIFWGCAGRVNIVNPEILKKMYDSGCRWMTYGVESGSQTILDEMKKRVKVDQAKNAILWTKKFGINTNPTFIIGYPSESRRTAMETVNFMRETGLNPDSLFFATPYPGTELFNQALEMGLISDVEEYLTNIDGKDAHSLIINLTRMTNEELISLRDEVLDKVVPGYGKRLRELLLKSIRILETDGLKVFFSRLTRWLKRLY